MPETIFAIGLVAVAFLIAFGVLAVFAMLDRRKASALRRFSEEERAQIVFLFDNETLLDATPAARRFLETAPRNGSAWEHLLALLSPRFHRIGERMQNLAEAGTMELTSSDSSSRLTAEWHDGIARITLRSTEASDQAPGPDTYSLMAMNHEIESLRSTANHTPYPVWREDQSGTVSWCNAAYIGLADRMTPPDGLRAWPPSRIFDITKAEQRAAAGGEAVYRQTLPQSGNMGPSSFDITVAELEDGEKILAAVPADELVRAETSLQEFITTLTKTFASLPIGLAIFDRSRALALFNPALMDLTSLPAAFLISKPTLSAFLDKLRAARMIPEPKDYKSWRLQISELEAAAASGTYEETWALPSGQTYRVTGRPHPDGAVALLFEDISAEMSITRRFRSELELSQATLDALPKAIAVFLPGGGLSICNSAYAGLWGDDPSTALEPLSVAEAISSWQAQCVPSQAWAELGAFVNRAGHREAFSAQIALSDGRQMLCRASPLAGGATLVDFSPVIAPSFGPALPAVAPAAAAPDRALP